VGSEGNKKTLQVVVAKLILVLMELYMLIEPTHISWFLSLYSFYRQTGLFYSIFGGQIYRMVFVYHVNPIHVFSLLNWKSNMSVDVWCKQP
jgi:hypothetical protein